MHRPSPRPQPPAAQRLPDPFPRGFHAGPATVDPRPGDSLSLQPPPPGRELKRGRKGPLSAHVVLPLAPSPVLTLWRDGQEQPH